MEIQIKWEKGLSPQNPARLLRRQVFQEEQGFLEEFDKIDETAWHVVVFVHGEAAACGRIFPADEGAFKLGRMAVSQAFRKQGLGAKTVAAMEEKAKALGASEMQLSAQCQAQGFYASLGYRPEGDVYAEEGCPHVKMTKRI